MRRRALLGLWATAGSGLALAHGVKAGALVIDHPYSPPTPSGARTAALYFRSLKHTGEQADRLPGAPGLKVSPSSRPGPFEAFR